MHDRIPLVDLGAQNHPLMPQFLRAAEDVAMNRGDFILGKCGRKIRGSFCGLHVGTRFAIGVSSGFL